MEGRRGGRVSIRPCEVHCHYQLDLAASCNEFQERILLANIQFLYFNDPRVFVFRVLFFVWMSNGKRPSLLHQVRQVECADAH